MTQAVKLNTALRVITIVTTAALIYLALVFPIVQCVSLKSVNDLSSYCSIQNSCENVLDNNREDSNNVHDTSDDQVSSVNTQ